jgi:Spy/CpxP family protein refolding chaperone
MNRGFRSRLTMGGLLIVIFASGALAGAAGDRLLHADETRGREHDTRRGEKRHRMERLFSSLDLAPEQRARVESVFERRRPRIDALWDECKSRMAGQIDSTNAEIRPILTPDQRETFDAWVQERDARHRKPEGNDEGSPAAP